MQPPPDLTIQELLDVVNQADFQVPPDIMERIKLAESTVYLSLRQGYAETQQGPMYLAFIAPCFLDFANDAVLMQTENSGGIVRGALVNFGGVLWLILPIGKRYTVDFSVKSENENTFFHVGVRYSTYSNEFVIEGTGSGQHLIFNVDTRQDVFYGIDIANRNRNGKRFLRYKEWTFFKCRIVELE